MSAGRGTSNQGLPQNKETGQTLKAHTATTQNPTHTPQTQFSTAKIVQTSTSDLTLPVLSVSEWEEIKTFSRGCQKQVTTEEG